MTAAAPLAPVHPDPDPDTAIGEAVADPAAEADAGEAEAGVAATTAGIAVTAALVAVVTAGVAVAEESEFELDGSELLDALVVEN